MPGFVAIVGTPTVGGVGVVGNPPLLPIPARPHIAGALVALVGDQVSVTFPAPIGTQILTITAAGASTEIFVNGIPVALMGTVLSNGVAMAILGAPPQVIVTSL